MTNPMTWPRTTCVMRSNGYAWPSTVPPRMACRVPMVSAALKPTLSTRANKPSTKTSR